MVRDCSCICSEGQEEATGEEGWETKDVVKVRTTHFITWFSFKKALHILTNKTTLSWAGAQPCSCASGRSHRGILTLAICLAGTLGLGEGSVVITVDLRGSWTVSILLEMGQYDNM